MHSLSRDGQLHKLFDGGDAGRVFEDKDSGAVTRQLLLHSPAAIGGRQPSERPAPIPTC